MNRTFRLACRFASVAAFIALAAPAFAGSLEATLYKDPECGCCEGYAAYLRENGFDVEVKPTDELAAISRKAGVPEGMQGCHTMFIDGYVVDGHAPQNVARRLTGETPANAGPTRPAPPTGSPALAVTKTEKYLIYTVPKDGEAASVYAEE